MTAFVQPSFSASARRHQAARFWLYFLFCQLAEKLQMLSCDWLNQISADVLSVTVVFVRVWLKRYRFRKQCIKLRPGHLWSLKVTYGHMTGHCDSDRHLSIATGQLTSVFVTQNGDTVRGEHPPDLQSSLSDKAVQTTYII